MILALGFEHVVHDALIKELGIQLDGRSIVVVKNYQTGELCVFDAGETIGEPSLVLGAINSGQETSALIGHGQRERGRSLRVSIRMKHTFSMLLMRI